MKTFNFVIPDDMKARLEAESGRSGAPLAEIARRAIDEYLRSRESSVSQGRQRSKNADALAPSLA